MRCLAIILMCVVPLFAGDAKKKSQKNEPKERAKIVSVEYDTIKIVRCTKTVLHQMLKDTAVVVKEKKTTSVTYDTLTTADTDSKKKAEDKKSSKKSEADSKK